MTTEKQRAANGRNAQLSTGPRSVWGKETASRNARRHGLTGAPDLDAVLSWYRVILNDPEAVLDPFKQDPYLRAAAELARAEAQLRRVQAAEDHWLLRTIPSGEERGTEARTRWQSTAGDVGKDRARPSMSRLMDLEGSELEKGDRSLGRNMARYRASAEARRRTALQRWITEFTKRSHSQLEAKDRKEDEHPLQWKAIPPSGLPSPKGVR